MFIKNIRFYRSNLEQIRKKGRRRYYNFLFLYILIVFLILLISLFLYQKYLQKKVIQQTKIESSVGISTLEKINLGGVDQWILIRGKNKLSPILLFLHGGPGAPLFPFARQIGFHTNLENHFILVYWEQRGTGKSYRPSIPPENMTIEHLVSDTHELIEILLDRFQVTQIHLLARSWGSLIGIFTVQKYPELISSYISIGQIVSPIKNDSLSYQYTIALAKRLDNYKALNELSKIGLPPYHYKNLIIQRKWLTKFSARKQELSFFSNLNILLSTPEYSLLDIFFIGCDPFFSLKHLWNEEYYKIDLFYDVPEVLIPVYFCVGKYDYFTPAILAEKYFKHIIAPKGKKLILFNNSGHHPEYDEPEKFYRIVVENILKNQKGNHTK